MRFTHKILLSPLVTAVAFMVIFAMTQRAAERSSENIAKIQDVYFRATELSHSLHSDLLSIRYLLTAAASEDDEEALLQAISGAANFRATMERGRATPELAALLDPLAVQFEDYFASARRLTEKILDSADGPGPVYDQALIDDVVAMNRNYADLGAALNLIIEGNNLKLEAAIADTRAHIGHLRWVMNATSVVFLGILVLLSVVVIRSIVGPVNTMSRVAQAISGGDLAVKLAYRSPDALGELADSIREMQSSLVSDLARRKEAEADLIAAQGEMVQSGKMAVLGKLVAGLAHELNTPLGTMLSSVDVLGRSREIIIEKTQCEADQDSGFKRATAAMSRGVENLTEATSRVEDIVNSLKVFSQLDNGEIQQTDINLGLQATLILLEPETPAGVTLARQWGDLDAVLGLPAQLNQAFLSILRHTVRDATPVGSVSVKTEQIPENVRVTITGTGRDYATEELNTLFNPSFSADKQRVRMDWEMAAASRIINRHNGTIVAASKVGEGTFYTIEIPNWSEVKKG